MLDYLKTEVKKILIDCLELEIESDDIEENDLLFGGYLGIDSIGTLILVEALEDEFDIEVEDEELTPELFESVKSLVDYVQSKVNGSVSYKTD